MRCKTWCLISVVFPCLVGCGSAAPSGIQPHATNRSQTQSEPEDSSSAVASGVLAGAIFSADQVIKPPSAAFVSICPRATLGIAFPAAELSGPLATLSFSACNTAQTNSAVWQGSENFIFDSFATLSGFETWKPSALLASGSLTITYSGALDTLFGSIPVANSANTRTSPSGKAVWLSTMLSDIQCYKSANACPMGQGIKTVYSTSGDQQIRFISIDGLRMIGTKSGLSTSEFDETVKSEPITVIGVGAARTVPFGVVHIFHNDAAFETVSSIKQTLTWAAANECHPNAGEIDTTCANGKTESLIYKGLGTAVVTNCDGTVNQITLKHCY